MPHGGFHEQRVALENALLLAKILDRTLLLPPLFLSTHPTPYLPSRSLVKELQAKSKDDLKHCRDFRPTDTLPLECLDYLESTQLSWDYLVDIQGLKSGVRIVDRWDMSMSALRESFGITQKNMYFYHDTEAFEWRIYDNPSSTRALEGYVKRLNVGELRRRTNARLIHFGSLFGRTRIWAEMKTTLEFGEFIKKRTLISNQAILDAADELVDKMGGEQSFVAVHVGKDDLDLLYSGLKAPPRRLNDVLSGPLRQPVSTATGMTPGTAPAGHLTSPKTQPVCHAKGASAAIKKAMQVAGNKLTPRGPVTDTRAAVYLSLPLALPAGLLPNCMFTLPSFIPFAMSTSTARVRRQQLLDAYKHTMKEKKKPGKPASKQRRNMEGDEFDADDESKEAVKGLESEAGQVEAYSKAVAAPALYNILTLHNGADGVPLAQLIMLPLLDEMIVAKSGELILYGDKQAKHQGVKGKDRGLEETYISKQLLPNSRGEPVRWT